MLGAPPSALHHQPLPPWCVQGRGTVVTGRIEQGIVKSGEEVEIVGMRPSIKTTVTGEGGAGAPWAWGPRPGPPGLCPGLTDRGSAA